MVRSLRLFRFEKIDIFENLETPVIRQNLCRDSVFFTTE